MNELLNRLAQAAELEQAVAQAVLGSGMRLLVYPLERGQLVVLGWPAASGHVVDGESLLRRRSDDLARSGAWLPVMFNDGAWYLARRVGLDDGTGLPDAGELAAAEELLQ